MTDPTPYNQPYGGPPPTEPTAPQYGPPGLPASPYGASPYATPYGAPPSPYGQYPPGFGYGYPPAPVDRRPGTLTAAAVLGYVAAGLLVLAGLLVFFGASIVHDFSGGGADAFTAEFVLDGLANLVAAGLLIGGSVSMTVRRAGGRLLYSVGAGITVAASIYWTFRWVVPYEGARGLIIYALAFAALTITGASLAFTAAGTRWLAGKSG